MGKKGGGGVAAEGEEQLVCKGWVGFLNDLIPVSAERLTVGIPVSPRDNGKSSSSHQPTSVSPQHLPSIHPLPFHPHLSLSPIVYRGEHRGQPARKSI